MDAFEILAAFGVLADKECDKQEIHGRIDFLIWNIADYEVALRSAAPRTLFSDWHVSVYIFDPLGRMQPFESEHVEFGGPYDDCPGFKDSSPYNATFWGVSDESPVPREVVQRVMDMVGAVSVPMEVNV